MNRFTPLRNYIFDRLYHPTQGYFCKPNFQVGELKAPIDFKALIGYDDYQRELAQKYPPNAWLTPCQIFKPYYGMTIASYLVAAHMRRHGTDSREKIRIVEAGAGTGSAAESILYFFSNFRRELLPLVEYTVVQISPTLSKRVEAKLSRSYPHLLKNGQVRVVNQDISDYRQMQPCFLLFFEVLDNMPHDKVLWNSQIQNYDQFVVVDPDNNQEATAEIASDPLIAECLLLHQQLPRQQPVASSLMDRVAHFIVDRMAHRQASSSKDLFLPTYLLRCLKRLGKNVPQCHLVVSDFDRLVTPVPGLNAPIVSRKGFRSDQKQDFGSYLVERGQADIFFPVDFALLSHMHQSLLGRPATVVKSYDFVQEFGFQQWAETKSSFNPIKEDFANTSFLVSDVLSS